MLDKEIQVFKDNIEEWLKSDSNKFVVIKDEQVLNFFNTFDEALSNAVSHYGIQPYLIRQVRSSQEEISIPALTLGLINANISHSS